MLWKKDQYPARETVETCAKFVLFNFAIVEVASGVPVGLCKAWKLQKKSMRQKPFLHLKKKEHQDKLRLI